MGLASTMIFRRLFEAASIPDVTTTIQVMADDSKRYAASGGWSFGRFVNGKPADKAQHQTCFACAAARVKAHGLVLYQAWVIGSQRLTVAMEDG
jgi:hypothetical protein